MTCLDTKRKGFPSTSHLITSSVHHTVNIFILKTTKRTLSHVNSSWAMKTSWKTVWNQEKNKRNCGSDEKATLVSHLLSPHPPQLWKRLRAGPAGCGGGIANSQFVSGDAHTAEVASTESRHNCTNLNIYSNWTVSQNDISGDFCMSMGNTNFLGVFFFVCLFCEEGREGSTTCTHSLSSAKKQNLNIDMCFHNHTSKSQVCLSTSKEGDLNKANKQLKMKEQFTKPLGTL